MRGIEQVEEELNEVVEIIAETSGKHEDTLREYIYYIVTLALSQGVTPKFTFSFNPSLDEKVNKKLVELSDAIKDILDTQVNNAINVITDISADDIESAVEYVNRAIDGEDIISRIDSYHSELKYILEAYIAAGIYKGLSASEIVQEYMIWKDSPLSSPTIREAMKHPIDFATPLILSLGFSFGSGLYRSTLANYQRLSSYTIAEAYNYGVLQTMRGNPKVVGYKTVRNSSYPCQVCDDLTMVVHPLDSLVVPAHPRCVCGIYPVYNFDN